MKKISWTTEKRTIDELIPLENNPRTMNEKQVEDLKKSITKFDLVEIPVIDRPGADPIIVAGHQRLKIMKALGRGPEVIDVRVPNRAMTEEEMREYNIRSNKNVGDWDWSLLQEFGNDVLVAAGFTEEELMMGFGLSDSDDVDIDEDRVQILTVFPPEAPKLKERAAIHFKTKEEYEVVKKWVLEHESDAMKILIKAAS